MPKPEVTSLLEINEPILLIYLRTGVHSIYLKVLFFYVHNQFSLFNICAFQSDTAGREGGAKAPSIDKTPLLFSHEPLCAQYEPVASTFLYLAY